MSAAPPPTGFGDIYAYSPTMVLFGRGDPGVVAGISGTELGQRLFREIRPDEEPPALVISTAGRSPEYWGVPFTGLACTIEDLME